MPGVQVDADFIQQDDEMALNGAYWLVTSRPELGSIYVGTTLEAFDYPYSQTRPSGRVAWTMSTDNARRLAMRILKEADMIDKRKEQKQ